MTGSRDQQVRSIRPFGCGGRLWYVVPGRASRRSGFTLIDVLVTLGVVVLLMGIMLPGLGKVQEISRQLVCRSNLRQIGLGLVLYADSSRDQLPNSVFSDVNRQKENEVEYSPEDMMTLRLSKGLSRRTNSTWDGLGLLYETEMLPSQAIFYCPSHHGNAAFKDVADTWRAHAGEIVGNYHFRGKGPNGSTRLSFIEPSRSALAADGLRTIEDYNHRVGLNVLRADLSLFWLSDPLGRIGDYIELAGEDSFDTYDFDILWDKFDAPSDTILPGR
ncbi:MAG: hypothetical protein Q9O74_05520 [Planctomycetota bacterium]|nr:hypothetical protein [Planctomycetota bacterium]